MTDRALTEKQRLFVDAYRKSGNASAAARAAGYSEATARQQGYQLLRHPAVAAALEVSPSRRPSHSPSHRVLETRTQPPSEAAATAAGRDAPTRATGERPSNRVIIGALAGTSGNVAAAAVLLEVGRSTLYRWIAEDEELRTLQAEIHAVIADQAQAVVFGAIGQGDTKVARWYLERRGQVLGYTRRGEAPPAPPADSSESQRRAFLKSLSVPTLKAIEADLAAAAQRTGEAAS